MATKLKKNIDHEAARERRLSVQDIEAKIMALEIAYERQIEQGVAVCSDEEAREMAREIARLAELRELEREEMFEEYRDDYDARDFFNVRGEL